MTLQAHLGQKMQQMLLNYAAGFDAPALFEQMNTSMGSVPFIYSTRARDDVVRIPIRLGDFTVKRPYPDGTQGSITLKSQADNGETVAYRATFLNFDHWNPGNENPEGELELEWVDELYDCASRVFMTRNALRFMGMHAHDVSAEKLVEELNTHMRVTPYYHTGNGDGLLKVPVNPVVLGSDRYGTLVLARAQEPDTMLAIRYFQEPQKPGRSPHGYMRAEWRLT